MKTRLLIEQHMHGAFGIDFNKASVEEMIFVSKELLKLGIGGYFPTLVTDSVENIIRQTHIIKEASSLLTKDCAEILGIHLEGIFINIEKKGIHNYEHFLPLTQENFEQLEDDFIKIVTLAPELDEGLLDYLSSKDIKIQAGHCVQCPEPAGLPAPPGGGRCRHMRPHHVFPYGQNAGRAGH